MIARKYWVLGIALVYVVFTIHTIHDVSMFYAAMPDSISEVQKTLLGNIILGDKIFRLGLVTFVMVIVILLILFVSSLMRRR